MDVPSRESGVGRRATVLPTAVLRPLTSEPGEVPSFIVFPSRGAPRAWGGCTGCGGGVQPLQGRGCTGCRGCQPDNRSAATSGSACSLDQNDRLSRGRRRSDVRRPHLPRCPATCHHCPPRLLLLGHRPCRMGGDVALSEEQHFCGRTLAEALAWCLVWLMAPELEIGPFLA